MPTKYEFDTETQWHTFYEDFERYTAGEWTITTTEAGAGSATEALADIDNSALVITNDAADNDLDFFQWTKETFKFEAGKKMYFKARFKILEVIQCDFRLGLLITDTTQLDVTDGIYFGSDDGDALLDFSVEKNNTATLVAGVHTLVADTFVIVGFYYDGSNPIKILLNTGSGLNEVGSIALTNMVDDEELAISFGLQNGEAVANILTIDYLLAKQER